jgi:hypothetical protein
MINAVLPDTLHDITGDTDAKCAVASARQNVQSGGFNIHPPGRALAFSMVTDDAAIG